MYSNLCVQSLILRLVSVVCLEVVDVNLWCEDDLPSSVPLCHLNF